MEHFFRLTTRSLASRLQVNSHDRPLWRQMQLRMNLSTLQLRSRKPADLTVTDEFFGEKLTILNDTAWPKKAVKATSTTIFIFFSQCVSLIEKGAKEAWQEMKTWGRKSDCQSKDGLSLKPRCLMIVKTWFPGMEGLKRGSISLQASLKLCLGALFQKLKVSLGSKC